MRGESDFAGADERGEEGVEEERGGDFLSPFFRITRLEVLVLMKSSSEESSREAGEVFF